MPKRVINLPCPRAYQPPSCLIELQQLPYLSLVTLSVTCSMASISLFPSLAPSQRRLFIVMRLCCVVLHRLPPPSAAFLSVAYSAALPLTYSASQFFIFLGSRFCLTFLSQNRNLTSAVEEHLPNLKSKRRIFELAISQKISLLCWFNRSRRWF